MQWASINLQHENSNYDLGVFLWLWSPATAGSRKIIHKSIHSYAWDTSVMSRILRRRTNQLGFCMMLLCELKKKKSKWHAMNLAKSLWFWPWIIQSISGSRSFSLMVQNTPIECFGSLSPLRKVGIWQEVPFPFPGNELNSWPIKAHTARWLIGMSHLQHCDSHTWPHTPSLFISFKAKHTVAVVQSGDSDLLMHH